MVIDPNIRRAAGVAFALLSLGAGYFVSVRVRSAADVAVRDEVRRRAETAGNTSRDALAAQLKELELKASAAASLSAIQKLANAAPDSATTLDFLKEEAGWEQQRRDFKISGLLFGSADKDAVLGLPPGTMHPESLIAMARKNHVASEIVLGADWPYLVAASVVDIATPTGEPAVVLLGKPLEESILQELSGRTKGAVLVSDGRRALLAAGPEAERERLRGLVGHETDKLVQQQTWGATAQTLAPGTYLWAMGDGEQFARESAQSAGTTAIPIYGGAVLLGAAGLFLGFRKWKTEDLLRQTSQQLSDTQEQLKRLTTSNLQARVDDTSPSLVLPNALRQPPRTGVGANAAPLPLDGSAPRLDPERVFGRYYLLNQLAVGGMGEVYTAVTFGAEGFRRTFVIKRLRSELAREPEIVSQFIDEARLGSLLVHSNVIPVFDFGKVGDDYFLAQEYILGRDLDRLTSRSMERDGKPLPQEVVFYVVQEVLKALGYAHSRHDDAGQALALVHRDVSPNNVLISGRGEVKLFDFGIVKATNRATKTQFGVVKGNVTFMSPEQAKGLEVDQRADLFSLGLVMYRCLTGGYLYNGENSYQLLIKAAAGLDAADWEKIRALPEPAATVIARALQADPSQRYASAAEFAAALPHLAANAQADVAALVQRLCGEDLRTEQARMNAAIPANPGALGT